VQSFRVYYTSSQVIFSHAPLFLHVSRAARHSRATFHALPNIHSACLAATHTEIFLCGAVLGGGPNIVKLSFGATVVARGGTWLSLIMRVSQSSITLSSEAYT
jgi:hypothetical protein